MGEGEINELEIALDHANKANNEAQKSIKRYQGQMRESECALSEESRVRQEMAEKASLADRRANAIAGEMEEARSLLDSAERGKRQTEAELSESRAAVNEMTSINSRAASDKRAVESAVHTMHAEIDDMLQQAKNSEEKAKKAMVDLLVWRMSSVLSRTTPTPRARLSAHLRPSCPSWSRSLLTPTRTPFVEVALPWPSLRLASVSWRSSLEMCRPTPERIPRATRSLSVAPRSSPSRLRRTRRTRTG